MTSPSDYVYITSADDLAQAASILRQATVLGVDTESDSLHSYQERVSLIQVSDGKLNAVVDPLLLPDVQPLAPLLADPGIVKVFHGADYDVVGLKRAGFDDERIRAIREAFRVLFRPGRNLAIAVKEAEKITGANTDVSALLEFIRTSKRGVCFGAD